MTADEAVKAVRDEVIRSIGASNVTDLEVEYLGISSGSHRIRVCRTAFGRTEEYTAFKSVSGFSSSISSLDGRSLGNPGTRR